MLFFAFLSVFRELKKNYDNLVHVVNLHNIWLCLNILKCIEFNIGTKEGRFFMCKKKITRNSLN